MLRSKYQIIHKVSLLVLFFMALSIIVSLVYSYSRFRTTVVQTTRPAKSFPYPIVSFCPGFHNHKRKDFPWLIPKTSTDWNRTVENFPSSRSQADQLWNETTYELKYFLKEVDIIFSDGTVTTLKAGSDWHCLKIYQLDTMSGKCYMMSLNCSSQINIVYWNLIFDLGAINRSTMSLHFHQRPEAAIFGLNMNFWYLSSTNKPIVIDSAFDIAVKRWIGSWKSGMDLEEYLACEQDTFSNSLNFKKLCWAPMFDACLAYATKGMNRTFSPCNDYLRFALAYSELTRAMNSLMSAQGQHRCTGPNAETTFATRAKENEAPIWGFTDKQGLAFASIYYDSDQVFLEEEYLLIDLGTLMSGIGGVIGAVLGWSLQDAANFCLAHIFS